MRTKFLEAFNAINLMRNGGLDFVGSGMPPFWQLIGAQFNTGSDRCSVVRNEVPASAQGAANYFKVVSSSSNPITLRHVFSKRFIQMAFARELSEVTGEINQRELDDARVHPAYDKERACQRLIGELSSSLSVRVPAGTASIVLKYVREGGQEITEVLYPALTSKDWVRPTVTVDMQTDRGLLEYLDVVITRARGDISEVHVGSFMTVGGAYSVLPYTGDPMADAIPRGAMVFAVGTTCPPGFEKVVLTPPSRGRAYLRGTAKGDLAVEGSDRHEHDAETIMSPEVDWSYMFVESGYEEFTQSYYGANVPMADLAEKAHTHSIDGSVAVPPSRDIIMCKRL